MYREDSLTPQEERYEMLQQAAENAVRFIKLCEAELGEIDLPPELEPMHKQMSFQQYEAMHQLYSALEYCYLYVNTTIFYDEE